MIFIHTVNTQGGFQTTLVSIIEAGKTSFVKPLLSNVVLVSPCYNHMLKVVSFHLVCNFPQVNCHSATVPTTYFGMELFGVCQIVQPIANTIIINITESKLT